MDYLKNHINIFGSIESLKNGLVYVRSVLHLDIASATRSGEVSGDTDTKRNCMLNADSFPKVSAIKDNIYQCLGEPFKDRRQTKVLSQGTVFGKESNFRLDFSAHSHYGMNPHYLNDVGVPNPAAISKRFREIAPSTDLKEQRLNRFMNVTMVSDFYDNATSLLFVLLQRLQLCRIMSKMASYDHKYTLTAMQAADMVHADDDVMVINLTRFIESNIFKMKVGGDDSHMYTICEGIRAWFRTLPDPDLRPDVGVPIPNPDFHRATYTFDVKYWQMYDYDDGHSQSGVSFGNVVGMIHNRHKVPSEWHMTKNYDVDKLTMHDMDIPVNDDAIDNFGKVKYYINCSSMSMEEVAVLAVAYQGNKRTTPFLVDQTIDFQHGEQTKAYALRVKSQDLAIPDVIMTDQLIRSTITKLVSTHKWYEELKAAATAMKYWLVQPATETVESHWWLNVERSLSLPKLGLRRAIFPMLLEGDGAQISAEALKISKILMSNNDSMMFESMIANTTWYWGEYMNQFNSNSVATLFHKMDNDYFDTLQPMERADALSSAVLGVAIPRPVFSQMGTYFSRGLRSHYRDTVSFGNIDIPHLQDYGYAVNGNRLSTNTLVCPSCTGFVTGLGGSLLNGTPYHSIFQIRAVTQRKVRARVEQAYNYYDLWAYGVVQRWQGYDVHYKHPRANQRHRIYAANNVSIAMPPVNPLTMEETLPYIMLQDTEREHGFGSSIEWLKNYNMYFVWNRTRIEALREPDYNAMPVQSDDRSMFNADRIQVATKAPKAYNCLLYATYDVDAADFHVAYPEIAVPLETNVGQLQLGEIDTGPIPEVPPDIGLVE